LLAQGGVLQGDLLLTAEGEKNETNRNHNRVQHGDMSLRSSVRRIKGSRCERFWRTTTSPDTGPDGWLFPSETLNTPLAKDNVWRRHIGPKLKAIGLGWVNFQVLRRSHATLMRAQDVDPKIVADQQAHTPDVNLNVYTQTSLESRIEAVQQLESALVH
jgi:integrase